ncbi:hypothetical protein Y1Q_0013007 [Alligator mississippiensis]|uniref:Integrase catalytic domain-containing protein n=1 Tax=Alligator mississippiensis TaxID=8496 RepID=A0A151MTK7_ALLMI|nr:hypothetical protein Y1Q_0013007 [Alligator mississippiensis]
MVFCQLGFPSKSLTDRGGNFMAEVIKCLWDCCGVEHLKTTAYYPQTNGLVERFNGTFKGMLKAYVDSNPSDWDEKLPHLLFAYQEVPQESTGFLPFELMFGRRVRGPLDLVREEWEGKIPSTRPSVVEYVLNFRQKLTDLMKMARDSLGQAQEKQRSWYDEKAHLRTFEQGDNVMVFLPLKTDKLQVAWEGPRAILDRLDEVTYVVAIRDRKPKTVHVNMLKPYYDRKEMVFWVPSIEGTPEDPEELVMYGDWDGEAGIEELRLPDHLPFQDKDQLLTALEDFETVFSNKPAPLHELTKKGSPDPVVWKQGCQEAFDSLKAALVKQPILKAPLHDKPFYVATDASDVGLGAVLLQEHQETRHPVVYLSRKLIPQKQNLSSIEKECLAIVWALTKLKPYLWGQQFTILSDHAPLQWLQTMQNTNAKLKQWAWQLQEFNFTVEHIKGSQNVIVDALSQKDSV